MKQIITLLIVAVFFLGCAGTNKVKVSGTLKHHNDNGKNYFFVKDDKTSKVYQIAKKSEASIKDKVGHKISMVAKISEELNTKTINSCTKCHHSIKEL